MRLTWLEEARAKLSTFFFWFERVPAIAESHRLFSKWHARYFFDSSFQITHRVTKVEDEGQYAASDLVL